MCIRDSIFPAGQQEIASGEVAMYLNGTFLPNEVKNSVVEDLEWGSFAFPSVENGINGTEANYYAPPRSAGVRRRPTP